MRKSRRSGERRVESVRRTPVSPPSLFPRTLIHFLADLDDIEEDNKRGKAYQKISDICHEAIVQAKIEFKREDF